MLAPLLGLTEHPHYTNDRYAQMESLAWAVVIAGVLVFVISRANGALLKRVIAAALGAMIVCWGALSYAQSFVWRDSETLFRYMLAELGNDPYHVDITWRLGKVYVDEGRPAEALPLLKETLRIYPVSPQALAYLEEACAALAEPTKGSAPDAATKRSLYMQVAEAYDRAAAASLQVEPMRLAAKYYGLAGDWEKAAARRETAIGLESEDGADRVELAKIYHEEHRDAEAREQLDFAVKSDATKATERERLLALWRATGTAPATMR
jgi:tetratricopeptide (TPR) repeat protein